MPLRFLLDMELRRPGVGSVECDSSSLGLSVTVFSVTVSMREGGTRKASHETCELKMVLSQIRVS